MHRCNNTYALLLRLLSVPLTTRLAPHFLPSHTRGNRNAALFENAAQVLASADLPEGATTTMSRNGESSNGHDRRDSKLNPRNLLSNRALKELDNREAEEDERRLLFAPNQRSNNGDRIGGGGNRKNSGSSSSSSSNNGKPGGRGHGPGRGNEKAANEQKASSRSGGFPWPVRGGATNDGFGVGLWAVLIDARALGLRDGEQWQYGVDDASSDAQGNKDDSNENEDDDDGTLDEPAANRRREAAIGRVLEYLATIPTEEKTRMRNEIIAAVCDAVASLKALLKVH